MRVRQAVVGLGSGIFAQRANLVHFAHTARADLQDDAILRERGVGFKFPVHLNSFRQIHPFQQILEARVVAERIHKRV